MTYRVHALTLMLTAIGTLSAQTPTVTASPVALTFAYQAGNALPPAQALSLRASAGTPSYTLAIIGVNALWLTATPDTGRLNASLSVRVNPTSLSAGTYTATISTTVTGVASPVNVPVTLVVTSSLPSLALSATSAVFSSPPAPPAVQTVKLSTSGSPLSFTATVAGAAWLTVSPASGVLLPGSQSTLTITVDPTGMVPQAAPYTGRITITAAGASLTTKLQAVAVSLTVNAPVPTITSIWPASVPVNSAATTITIRGGNFYNASAAKVTTPSTPLTTTVLGSDALLAVLPANLLNAAGSFTIFVSNPAPGGDSVPMTFTVGSAATIQAVTSAASMLQTSISPGELITLFGPDIGPVIPATLADADNDGFVDLTLNGTSATVDNISAPIVYTSQNQVTIQVPYGVSIGANKVVAVTKGAGIPVTTTATIAATAPGLFTIDGTGAGEAAVLNYNAVSMQYSVNSATNAAKLGDTIILYVTGEGDYATTIVPRTGYLVPVSLTPIPQISPLPVVTIGGATATVNYAGPALGSMLGLLQLNVVVPGSSTTGVSVPVSLTIGGVATQSNVSIALK